LLRILAVILERCFVDAIHGPAGLILQIQPREGHVPHTNPDYSIAARPVVTTDIAVIDVVFIPVVLSHESRALETSKQRREDRL